MISNKNLIPEPSRSFSLISQNSSKSFVLTETFSFFFYVPRQSMWRFTFQLTVTTRFIRKTTTRNSLSILSWRSWRVRGRPSVSSSTSTCTTATVRMATRCTGGVTTIQGRWLWKVSVVRRLKCAWNLSERRKKSDAGPDAACRTEKSSRTAAAITTIRLIRKRSKNPLRKTNEAKPIFLKTFQNKILTFSWKLNQFWIFSSKPPSAPFELD